MKPFRLPGILGYATLAMWLLHLILSPVRAESLPISDLTPIIEQALIEAGAPADARITLSAPETTIDIADAAAPEVLSTSYNSASGRFLVRMSGGGDTMTAITGVAQSVSFIPVLVREIARGEIIAEADLDWIESESARPGLYLDAMEDIVGKEAKRPMREGAPIRKNDVAAPILVRRGEVVTMLIEGRGLRLTQTGVAQQNGAQGDIVDIQNINSDRLIKAVVIAENMARVPTRSPASHASLH